jgi:glc operon protein GlcG
MQIVAKPEMRENNMMKQTWSVRTGLILVLAALAFALAPADALAQGIEKFVVTGDAAKKALTRSEISGDTAAKIAQACQDFAAQHNISVSVFILSPSGNVVHAHRMDGLNPINVDTALYKAQTALYMRTSTHAAANRFDMAAQVTRLKLNQFFVSGGLPIIVDDQLIGAIGVGGSSMDEKCAYAALTAVLGPQPPLAEDQPRGSGLPSASPQG